MDILAGGNTRLHCLDPRSKLITTSIFIIMIVSFDKYSISALIPFFIYPIVLASMGGIPARYILKKILLISPFVIMLGILNPLLDKEILMHINGIEISGGWISFLSIILRFLLTVSSALILLALTGFNSVCRGLSSFGIPKVLITQILLFNRYILILADEAERMGRAMSLKTFGSGLLNFKSFILIIGHLLLRTVDRAERIYHAMCCRGFEGTVPVTDKNRFLFPLKGGLFSRTGKFLRYYYPDILFVWGWTVLFILLKYVNFPMKLGALITGILT